MKRLLCSIFSHRYRLTRKVCDTIFEVDCKRCGKEFGINTEVKAVLPLDAELIREHNRLHEQYGCLC